jgi:acetyl esterase
VNYQKSPEHKFPVPHDDCFATLMWLIDNHRALDVDRNHIGISGDSAGGNLAAGIALRARDSNIEIAFQVLIYPAVTLNFNSESYVKNAEGYGLTSVGMQWLWEQYLNEKDKTNPYAVPGVAEDFRDLPPAIVVTAEYDVLRDDGILYAELLRKASNQVEHEISVVRFMGFGPMPNLLTLVLKCAHGSLNKSNLFYPKIKSFFSPRALHQLHYPAIHSCRMSG